MAYEKNYIVPTQNQVGHINREQYFDLYQQSIHHTEDFWSDQANAFITWFKPWRHVLQGDFSTLDVSWFVDGKLNACFNCVDRHLEARGNQIALIAEGNHPNLHQTLTYSELHEQICRLANVLKQEGVRKGDRVCIYLPMIPEAVIAMLACARLGAIHSVVFAGFSSEALKNRILDADCCLLITADEGLRAEKTVPIKAYADKALEDCPSVKRVIVVEHTGGKVSWNTKRDLSYRTAIENAGTDCPVEEMDASDPLFILYTSGSTGKPKGIVHTTGGYMVYAAMTHQYVFDYKEGDVHWCTADIGWITGHSYCVYGPLANGATSLIFEGVPTYPTLSRYWEIIDKHQVNIFYTSPTAIRALRKEGDQWVKNNSRRSLKLLGSVGEPINPDVWMWYYEVVGDKRCVIVDTWWQTETGGVMIAPIPGATPLLPGAASWPFLGIVPEIIDDQGHVIQDARPGRLVIKQPWPGLMQTIYGDKQRFAETYFNPVPGAYLTGDLAYRNEDGYLTILGRHDDVINVSGHRFGTEELESAFLSHEAVAEAAVVGVPNEITGEGIFAFITTKQGIEPNDGLKLELNLHLRDKIGPIAKPDVIQWSEALPKTRSGKVMRRILRKIASGEFTDLGDISTLADQAVIDELIAARVT